MNSKEMRVLTIFRQLVGARMQLAFNCDVINCGPQGVLWGPILFLIQINNFESVSQLFRLDAKLYFHFHVV